MSWPTAFGSSAVAVAAATFAGAATNALHVHWSRTRTHCYPRHACANTPRNSIALTMNSAILVCAAVAIFAGGMLGASADGSAAAANGGGGAPAAGGLSVTVNGVVHSLPALPQRPGGHAHGASDALVQRFCDAQNLQRGDCATLQAHYARWLRGARAAATGAPADDARYFGAPLTRALDGAVRKSGAPLEGNCMYRHVSDLEPHPDKRLLRANLHTLGARAARVLEVGFNAGHSNLMFLFGNAAASIVNVDLCVHAYTRPAFDVLRAAGANVQLVCGDSVTVLPKVTFAEGTPPFDLVHIDGGHGEAACFHDIVNAKRLSGPETLLVVDDAFFAHIEDVLGLMQRANFLAEVDYASLGLHEMDAHRVFRYVFDGAAPHVWFGPTGKQGSVSHHARSGLWQARGPYPKYAPLGDHATEGAARAAVATYRKAHPEEWL